MTHEHDHVDEPQDRGSMTGFAAVKYGFIFLIVIAVLYFTAAYLLPALNN
ncbi:MAG: hypothetical protein KatS3mg013_1872 [Actinomycetota bacterium]|jgi:hypothetical protein|nr:MAG: hypothetical protein KatS3mg013_1872 [Actinomycetota bacterium]